MKVSLLALGASLGLLSGCHKASVDPEAVPADIQAAFGQDFQLHYQQQVRLPNAGQPALTLQMTALQYSYCPQDVNCFVASFAWPTLQIADAQGRVSQLRLPVNASSAQVLALLDTTSFVSNSRRYALVYTRWDIGRALRSQEMPRRSDFGLWLRVSEVRP